LTLLANQELTSKLLIESISVDDRGLPVFADNLLWGADNGTTVICSGGNTDAALEPLIPGPGGPSVRDIQLFARTKRYPGKD
jgi:hypothetical protein